MNEALISLLRCPRTGSPLRYDPAKGELRALPDGPSYPVRKGIPDLRAKAAARGQSPAGGDDRRRST